MPSTQCAKCGHALAPAARFCSACGCAVARPACRACGAPADAGARFCTQCGGPQAPALIPQRPLIEQRQATVVNFDIVNYTELTTRLDPQDLCDAVDATFGAIRRIVYENRGDPQASAAGPGMLTDRVIGDSLMFLFGYPTASDDDAERATRAALLAATAVSRLEAVPGVALQVRVGVATGAVVVGVKEDGGPDAEPVVTGPAPNLAARLRELAAPGGVVIADTTWRLVGNYFRCDDLGPVALKGIGTDRAWRLIAPKQGGYRFGTRELAGLTPLVGRKHEIGLLLDRWALAREGRGQAVFVSGEPGVGKSRILSEFEMSRQPDQVRVLRFQCTPYHRNSAFYPIIENLLRDLNLDAEDAAGVRREQLEEALVGTLGLRAEDAAAIASVLVSPSAGAAPAVVVSQQERRRASTVRCLPGPWRRSAPSPRPAHGGFQPHRSTPRLAWCAFSGIRELGLCDVAPLRHADAVAGEFGVHPNEDPGRPVVRAELQDQVLAAGADGALGQAQHPAHRAIDALDGNLGLPQRYALARARMRPGHGFRIYS